ncbi:hypothetical protein HELRODRAFT_162200 [Helobdella robusta]|uniref:G-protein coupled receptors family 1 profile domain-containing protein n=1 Tax=Helobdella robusta TaxID=6412 RepID=T1ESC5_HELRO|nr:hypothetical protein HELRODRAFT_162200 [Helobdella robusta]ESN98748.1 hypothetical protein HELRODRAFT_162200 [Helobdella robusta]
MKGHRRSIVVELWNDSLVQSARTAAIQHRQTHTNTYTYDYQETWGWWVLHIGTPTLSLFGIPGNLLTIIIMRSNKYRSKSYSHFLTSLAVFDSIILISKCTKRMLYNSAGFDEITLLGTILCKLHNFSLHVCYLMTSWLVICLTIERLIAVHYPFLKIRLCRAKQATIIIIILFLILSYSQIFRLVHIGMYKTKQAYVCTSDLRYLRTYLILHTYVYQLVLQCVIPSISIISCNMFLLFKLKFKFKMLKGRHMRDSISSTHSKKSSLDLKTTFMLLVISFLHVVTLVPTVALTIVVHITIALKKDLGLSIFLYTVNISSINLFSIFLEIAVSILRFTFGEVFQLKPHKASNEPIWIFNYKKLALEYFKQSNIKRYLLTCSNLCAKFRV